MHLKQRFLFICRSCKAIFSPSTKELHASATGLHATSLLVNPFKAFLTDKQTKSDFQLYNCLFLVCSSCCHVLNKKYIKIAGLR